MPFFLKPCIKLRKKKKNKAVKKSSSMYIRTYVDKESSLASSEVHEKTLSSFASTHCDESDLNSQSKVIFEELELKTQSRKVVESEKNENIAREVFSPDSDILDILSYSAEPLTEEETSSQNNQYSILSSSSRQDVNDGFEFRELMNVSSETSVHNLNDSKEQLISDISLKKVEDLVGCQPLTPKIIIGKMYPKSMVGIICKELNQVIEKTKTTGVKETPEDFTALPSAYHRVTEVEALMPVTIRDCYTERLVPSTNKKISSESSECIRYEMTCNEIQDILLFETSKTDLIPSSEKNDLECDLALNMQRFSTSPASSEKQQDNQPKSQFFDTELSLAVQRALGTNLHESNSESNQEHSANGIDGTLDKGALELSIEPNQDETEEISNLNESVSLSFGDTGYELLEKKDLTIEDTLLSDIIFSNSLNFSTRIDEPNSLDLSDCSGDHSANRANTFTKELTCKMAATLTNDIPPMLTRNQIDDPKSENCHTICKRKSSRNVLISSLKVRSPEDFTKDRFNESKDYSDMSKQKYIVKPNEKNNVTEDLDEHLSQLNHGRVDDEAIDYKNNMSKNKYNKILETYIDQHTNYNRNTVANYLEKNDAQSFIKYTLKTESSTEKCGHLENGNTPDTFKNFVDKHRIDSTNYESKGSSFENNKENNMRILQVIQKLLRFSQKELNLFYENNEYDPNRLNYFKKEVLFDYKFYNDQKSEKILEKQKSFEKGYEKFVERDGTKNLCDRNKCLSLCKFKCPKIETYENPELLKYKHNTDYDIAKSFAINTDRLKCERETSQKVHKFDRGEINSNVEFSKILLKSETRNNEENNLRQLKLSKSLSECFSLEERLKWENKIKTLKISLLPTNRNTDNLLTSNIFKSKMFRYDNKNTNPLLNYSPTEIEALNNLEHSNCGEINLYDEIKNDEILEPSCFASECAVNKIDSCKDILKSSIEKSPTNDFGKEEVESEMAVSSDESEARPLESNENKFPQIEKSTGNQFTILLGPRKNGATVDCNVNMTIAGNTFICPTTSPVSIRVTQEGIITHEMPSKRAKDFDSENEAEEFSEMNRRWQKTCILDSKSLELKRLRNLELFELNVSEAMKPMKKPTRIIPIHPAGSYEFTLSNFDSSIKTSKKHKNPSTKSRKNIPPKLLTPHQFRSKSSKHDKDSNIDSSSSTLSSTQDLGIDIDKKNLNEAFHKRCNSPSSTIYQTPMRKKILTASQSIRSQKYSLKTEPSPLKESRHFKASPYKLFENNPQFYFLSELPSGSTRENKRRYKVKENAGNFEDRLGRLSSTFSSYRQHLSCSKLSSPTDLNSKFDHAFKRYARRGRNTGDLISYRRSTQWLRDAGIVGRQLSAEEADRAFKCAAGVKVALNKHDYRRFLYKLSRLKRLRYTEIYERLSESLNEVT